MEHVEKGAKVSTKKIEVPKAEIEKIAEGVMEKKLKDMPQQIPEEQVSGIIDEASKKALEQLHPEMKKGFSALNSRVSQLIADQQANNEAFQKVLEEQVHTIEVETCPNCGYTKGKLGVVAPEGQPPEEQPKEKPPEAPPEAPPEEPPAEEPPATEVKYIGRCTNCTAKFDAEDKKMAFKKCPNCGADIVWVS